MIAIEVTGLAELDEALRRLPDAIQTQVVRDSLKAAGQVLQKGMETLAPRAEMHRVMRRGKPYPIPLARSIGMRVSVARSQARAQVGPMQRAFWGRFQETGTRTMSAQPFMRPALEAFGGYALEGFVTVAKAKLADAVRTANPQGGTGAGP